MANDPAAHPQPGGVPPAEHPGHFPWKIVLSILIIGAIVLVVMIRRSQAGGTQTKGPGGRGGGGGMGSNLPVTAILGTAQSTNVPIFLDGIGTVQAFNTVTVRSRVDGNVTKINFDEGQDVHAGDVLAQIDSDPYRTQVEQAEGKKGQDEAQLQNAKIELKRNDELLKSKIVSQEVYDAAAATVRQLDAAVKADQAAIDSTKVQLAYTTITAPIDGRTGLRMVDVGNVIRAADSNGVVVLTQLRPISVVFTLPEQKLKQIQSHQSQGQMLVLAVDRDNHTTLDEGKLTVFDNQIDTSTGTIRLKATFPNEKLSLWPGQFVNARLLLQVRTNGIVVPASVVQRGPNGPYAFVVAEDMKARMQPVTVAQIESGQALIDSGLESGQRVVVDGQYKLQPGSTVRPAQTDGTPTGRPEQGSRTNANKHGKQGKQGKPAADAKQDKS
jgi:membrane fusion protein, multidrug efflux system